MVRGRLENLYQQHAFTLLLVALLLTLVLTPQFEGSRVDTLLFTVSLTTVFITGTLANRDRKWVFRAALVIAGLAVPISWGLLFFEERTLNFGQYVVIILFCGMTAVMVLLSVLRSRLRTGQAVVGAICVYLLIGLTWATIYQSIEMVEAEPFHYAARRTTGHGDQATTAFSQLVYFSFVTMTTLGYGDISPRTALAETACWLEAIVAQLYLAILIARLVSEIPVIRHEASGEGRDEDD